VQPSGRIGQRLFVAESLDIAHGASLMSPTHVLPALLGMTNPASGATPRIIPA
jgi:hypothetical protein